MNGNGNGNNILIQAGDHQAEPLHTGRARRSLLQILWERLWMVSAVTLMCLAAGLVYLQKTTPLYTSSSRLYVEQQGPRIIMENEGVMTQSKNYLYTQCELIKSTPILSGAMERPAIRQLKTFADVDNLTSFAKGKLSVTVGKEDDLISVSFECPYPEEAAQIVNTIVDSYISHYSAYKRSTAVEVLKILQKEKVRSDADLADRLQAMLKFKQEVGNLLFESDRDNPVLQRLTRLSDALTTAQLDTINAKAYYQAAQTMLSDPAKIRYLAEAQRGEGRYESYANEKARITAFLLQIQLELLVLEDQCTPEHPAVQRLQSQIARLKEQLAYLELEFSGAFVIAVRQKWEIAETMQEEIQAVFDQQQTLARELTIEFSEYAMLELQLKRSERLSDIIHDRIKEINVTEDTGALNISILETARPGLLSKPNKRKVMAMAVVLGLMLGGGLALGADWKDQRLRSPEEIAAVLDTPVLGVVPHMAYKNTTPILRGQMVHLEPQSATAEAYRTIRTAVYFGAPDGAAKTLLVTSPNSGDGKSTMVSNLAIAMAQAGQRTLILDGDFRNPIQHKIFETQRDGGLSNILSGRGLLNESIQRTRIEGLEVLPCGPIPPNPSEMLNSRAFANLLEELSKRYDHILIDSPPVIPMADARILGAICDTTILVLRAGDSTYKAAEQSREGLLGVGAHILGAVVNNVPRGRKGSEYYGYYSGYGSYPYGSTKRKEQSMQTTALQS